MHKEIDVYMQDLEVYFSNLTIESLDKLDYFYELYEKALFNGHDLHITEKHEDFGPLIVDLDFKY